MCVGTSAQNIYPRVYAVCVCVGVGGCQTWQTQRCESQEVASKIRLAVSESGPVRGYMPDLVFRLPCTYSARFSQPE